MQVAGVGQGGGESSLELPLGSNPCADSASDHVADSFIAPLVVVVLNNRGYSTEREILEGPFNDVHEWHYERICDMIGGGVGRRITTQGEFEQGLAAALIDSSHLHVMNVLLSPADRSAGMIRLAHRLAKRLSTDRP